MSLVTKKYLFLLASDYFRLCFKAVVGGLKTRDSISNYGSDQTRLHGCDAPMSASLLYPNTEHRFSSDEAQINALFIIIIFLEVEVVLN